MKTGKWMVLIFGLALLLTVGCAGNRANIKALSQEQQTYYGKLNSLLEKNRSLLELGLNQQLKADQVRQQELMDWERDLRKAEVLLQVDANVTGNQKLLSMKLAELNLVEVGRFSKLQVDTLRKEAILKLYDNLRTAVAALEKNNDVLVNYLGSGDKEFALRSLDVEGIVRVISIIRSAQEELAQIEERSDEERQKENERIQKSIERARDLLVTAFKK